MWRALGKSEEAVSEIVGELMLVAVTVMIFAMLVVSVSSMVNRPQTNLVTLDVQVLNSTAITLLHHGGDSLPFDAIGVSVNGKAMSFLPADANGNSQWDVGDSIDVPGLNTGLRLDIVIYNRVTNQALGSFIIG